MLLTRVFVGHLARRTAREVLINNSCRRHLTPACFASLDQFQPNHLRLHSRSMSTDLDSKTGQWSEEELKTEPEKPKQEIHPLDAETWTPLYRFKYIRQLRFVVRFKMYQAAVCIATTAALHAFPSLGVEVVQETEMLVVAVNLYFLLASLALGHYAQQMVGLLYVNEPKDKVRVATLTFLGHRFDVMHDVKDIVPFSDMVQSRTAAFASLTTYSNPKEKLLLYLNEGITNKALFEEVLGTLPELNRNRVTKLSNKKDK